MLRAESVLQMFINSRQHLIWILCPAGSQMGQGLWRIARNQQLQQQGYSGQGYLTREHGRRIPANNVSNTSHRKQAQGGIDIYHLLKTRKSKEQEGFINLEMLPPELSFTILSYLNATDLCLASCVWQDLANDELLWQGLCKSTWGHCSIYNKNPPLGFSFRKLYMQLDEGSLTFNANPDEVSELLLTVIKSYNNCDCFL